MAYPSTALAAVKQAIELAIPHEMSTPEWAETFRVVDRGARKGKWSNETVPFLTEIMAAADDPFVREIVFQKSSQVGGSEVINNIIGKRIHLAPTEMIYCAETEDKATAWTQESFDSMIRVTPELRHLISVKSEENNQKFKAFHGGGLHVVWATSPTPLSSRPAQLIFFDEKAGYKPTREGDAVKLGQARQKTYDGEQLTVFISTPRRCECSASETCGDISHDFERGDQCDLYVPCPHCNEFQMLKFGGKDTAYGLKWDDSPDMPYYLCEHCASIIEEFDREDMLAKYYWRPSKPFNGVRSFRVNQIYSPFVSWGSMVVDFLEAKRSMSKLEVWTNTVMGEVWKPIEQIEYEDLTWNLEEYPAVVPPGVLMLTAGVDVQKDRIECEVVGWGKDHESWSIDYKVFYGSPGIEVTTDEDGDDEMEPLSSVWDELAAFLMGSFPGVSRPAFRIQCVGIDYGYLSTIVAKFCKKYAAKRWYAVKGVGGPLEPLLKKPTVTSRGPKVRLFPVGTNAAKDDIYSAFKVEKPGPAYCHFPDRQPYNEDAHKKQLCSERMVTHIRGGRTYRVYEPVAKNIRNEALDVRVYALAARAIFPPNYAMIEKRRLQHTEVADRPEEVESRELRVESGEPPPKPTTPKARVLPFKVKNNPFEGYRV